MNQLRLPADLGQTTGVLVQDGAHDYLRYYEKNKRQEVLEVAQKHGVTSLRILGSVARGEETGESDIDILVTTGPKVSPWFPAGLILDLESLLERPIDMITESGLNPLLREKVLGEAVAP